MNTTRKIIIAALVLILIGAIIVLFTMCNNNWNIPGVVNTKTETLTYEMSESFENISMSIETGDLVFVVSNNSRCRIEITDNEDVSYNVGVKDKTLYVEKLRKSGFYVEFGSPKITVYLPKTEYKDLHIKGSTGEVVIPSSLSFKNIDVDMSTGDISCSASASETASFKVSTGEIDFYSASAKYVYLRVSTGTTEVEDVKCESLISNGSTGMIKLENVIVSGLMKIERSTGDVELEKCDAAEIDIETSTGDITGSLLSSKVFIARSGTGRIQVPETLTGGRCTLISDTGRIEIEIL